jgi:hypothetical protein
VLPSTHTRAKRGNNCVLNNLNICMFIHIYMCVCIYIYNMRMRIHTYGQAGLSVYVFTYLWTMNMNTPVWIRLSGNTVTVMAKHLCTKSRCINVMSMSACPCRNWNICEATRSAMRASLLTGCTPTAVYVSRMRMLRRTVRTCTCMFGSHITCKCLRLASRRAQTKGKKVTSRRRFESTGTLARKRLCCRNACLGKGATTYLKWGPQLAHFHAYMFRIHTLMRAHIHTFTHTVERVLRHGRDWTYSNLKKQPQQNLAQKIMT